jgi:hypothetical protein
VNFDKVLSGSFNAAHFSRYCVNSVEAPDYDVSLPDRALDTQEAGEPDMQRIIADATYTHNEGSVDEWSLTWTKVDGDTEVVD